MSAFRADWQRLAKSVGYRGIAWWVLDQSFWVILTYRCISKFRGRWFFVLLRIPEKLAEFVFKCYVPATTKIGPGLIIYHAFGIILNGKAEIGNNCTLYARVCIGNRWPGDGAPTLGDNVTVGTGACIFGPVVIPDDSVIKANAVITPTSMQNILSGAHVRSRSPGQKP